MHHVDMERARREMAAMKLDVLIAGSFDNVFYCTGNYSAIWGEMRDNRVRLAVIPRDSAPFVTCPESEARSYARSGVFEIFEHPLQAYFKYEPGTEGLSARAKSHMKGIADLGELDGLKDIQLRQPILLASKILKDRGLSTTRVGVDKEFMSVPVYEEIGRALPGCEIVDASQAFMKLRVIKTSDEVECLRGGLKGIMKGMKTLAPLLKVGGSLSDVRRHLIRAMSEGDGCEPRSIAPILDLTPVRSGEVANLADVKFKKGQVLMVDTGGQYNHYRSDIARSWALGDVGPRERVLYETILQAQEAMMSKAHPGTKFSELYRIGNDRVRRVDPEYYRRRTMGHSIGIAAREWPDVKPLGDEVLQPGMVICLEVPYYVGGGHSFSVEDEFLITESGHERLSEGLSRELQVVE
jgi:Xaa-Pro aminopeptidase